MIAGYGILANILYLCFVTYMMLMDRRLITMLILMLLAGVGNAFATGKIDSLSYVLGYQASLGAMEEENALMQSDTDFQDYIRGLEDNCRDLSHMSDSSYMLSYCIGAMEAIFLTDGMHGRRTEDLPPFSCIIAGLRKVGTGQLSLPADTVAAMSVINKYSVDGMTPKDLDKDACCKFFEAYGTMKALKPGLQEYMDGLKSGSGCVADRKAFATGMADMLELFSETPRTAYDLGKSIAFSLNYGAVEKDSPDMASFVAGAKVALGLGDELIAREEVEKILNQLEMLEGRVESIEDNAQFENLMEYFSRLEIEIETPYKVDWTVTAGTVADVTSGAYQAFIDLVSKLGLTDDLMPELLLAQSSDEDGLIYEAVLSEIGNYKLPNGYKWFCGRNNDGQTTTGIMLTVSPFNAKVHKAKVGYESISGMTNVVWKFEAEDALKWAGFTGANIGKHIAMEIDGVFMFVPRVNQQITGGACAVSSLRPEVVNRLFKNAESEESKTPVDTIEIIDAE